MPETTLPSAAKLWSAYHDMCLVERCDAAISQYEEAGFSGTVHDIENKCIREDAVQRVVEALTL